MEEQVKALNELFVGYKIKAECVGYEEITHFVVYHIKLKPGCKVRALELIGTEIQLGMQLLSVPIFTPAPELGIVKMVSTRKFETIQVETIIDQNDKKFNAYVGIDSDGKPVILDFNKAPHLLVAGATGSGKSVFLHAIIANLIKREANERIDLYLIDPKMVEFEAYKGVKTKGHLSISNTYVDAIKKLYTIHSIMDKRFKLLSKLNCKSVTEYNSKNKGRFSRIVCVIDELADLMLRDVKNGSKMERLICSIAAKARAAGIHLILATQRPSIDVVTGLIKANFPIRVCFRVSSNTDSRVVLDYKGAENLNGRGDGILSGYSNKQIRFQSVFSDPKTM